MSKKAPLSPPQYSAYAMGRILILFDTWSAIETAPLDLERAMLIDFAAQYPRALVGLVPPLERVIRAHRLQQGDLAELFASRQFHVLRERFSVALTSLLARDLIAEASNAANETVTHFRLTQLGNSVARHFTSALSLAFRGLHEVLCEAWHRRNIADLSDAIRTALPAEARRIADLLVPFPPWLTQE